MTDGWPLYRHRLRVNAKLRQLKNRKRADTPASRLHAVALTTSLRGNPARGLKCCTVNQQLRYIVQRIERT
ncbi:hypothetical protein ACLK10_11850 [Escherichia coli]